MRGRTLITTGSLCEGTAMPDEWKVIAELDKEGSRMPFNGELSKRGYEITLGTTSSACPVTSVIFRSPDFDEGLLTPGPPHSP